MRVLIDTNVFIQSESNKIIESEVAELLSLAIKHHITIMVHPASLEDLSRDTDMMRKKIHRSKFEKYPVLEDTAKPDGSFTEAVGGVSRPQDEVDNKILYSIFKNAANFLITEDFGIHRKAGKLGIGDRVLSVSQALLYLKRQFERYIPGHILLENIPIHNLDLKSDFFDSLRENYPGFDDWFVSKGKEGRMCWSWRGEGGELRALLIYTEKDKQIFRESKEKVLKICTFKVSENVRGLKVGELLLKMTFKYCVKNNLSTTYLTTYPKKEYLRILLEDFGFIQIDESPEGELIYAKDFMAPASLGEMRPLDYCKKFFPNFYDGDHVNKFMIPIRPEYHDRLFPDVPLRQTLLDEYKEMVIEQNTIKKAYICNSKITKINAGDILLFYRSKKKQGITGIGVVESTMRHPSSLDELIAFIGPRSVYSPDELQILYERGALAILFRYIGQLPSYVPSEKLRKLNVFKHPPQSIVTIDDISYQNIRRESKDG